jgi:hypothetical protein
MDNIDHMFKQLKKINHKPDPIEFCTVSGLYRTNHCRLTVIMIKEG